jgi:hypothetical protein
LADFLFFFFSLGVDGLSWSPADFSLHLLPSLPLTTSFHLPPVLSAAFLFRFVRLDLTGCGEFSFFSSWLRATDGL